MGELIDRSVSLWRRELGNFFRLFLGFQLAQYVLTKLYLFSMKLWAPAVLSGARPEATGTEELFSQLAAAVPATGGMLLLYFLITWLAGVAGSLYAAGAYYGKPLSVGEAARWAGKKAPQVLAGFALSLVWLTVVGIVVTLPGVAVGIGGLSVGAHSFVAAILSMLLIVLGWLVVLLWYLLRFFLVSQVIALENLSVFGSLKRCGALVSGRVGPHFMDRVVFRATVLISVISLVLTSVSTISGLPALVLEFAYGATLAEGAANAPQAWLIPAELLQVLATSIFTPLYVVFGVVFYADMRARREGLDLELRLQHLGSGK